MSRWAALGFLAFALAALVFTLARVATSYDWVVHTSDVRVVISSARSAVDAVGREADACDRIGRRLDDIERLTTDNPAQLRRVTRMRQLQPEACAGEPRDLEIELGNADAAEVALLYARRDRLTGSAATALGLFVASLLGAIAAAASAVRARRETERRFRDLAESATDLIRIHAPDGHYLYVTPSCETLLGYTPHEILAMPAFGDLTHEEDRQPLRDYVAKLGAREDPPPITHRLRRKDGAYRWFETRSHAVYDARGRLERFFTTSRDIDDRIQAEHKLESIAVTDELTQLNNRRGFMMLAGHEHRLAQRQGRGLLLVFVDLDGLKAINDGLGHEQGDAAIRDFAGVMRSAFRASDIVARLGGDEFAALAYDIDENDAGKVEARVATALDEFNADKKRPYRLAASVGTTILKPGDALTLEQLVAEADRAMYERKRAKRQHA